MKRLPSIGAGLSIILMTSAAVAQAPLSAAFTYQGQLKQDGDLADGSFNLVFTLWDAASGGSQVGGPDNEPATPVSEGLFTVQLNDAGQFGPSPFLGDARWVQVAINGAPPLTPRQPLTAAPYALFALNAPSVGGFWAANGNHIYKSNSGNVGVGTTAPDAPLEVRERLRVAHISSGGPFVVPGSGILDLQSNATTSSYPYGQIRFMDGAEETHAAIEYGSGPLLLDGIAMRFATEGSTRMSILSDGNVGIGTLSPEALLHIDGNSDSSPAGGGLLVLGDVAGGNVSIDANEIMARDNGAPSTLFFNHNGGNVLIDAGGSGTSRVGIGTNSPNSRLHVSTASMQLAQFNQFGESAGFQITSTSANTTHPALSVAGFSNNAPALRVTGTASVSVLEITGADVAEKFPTSECAKIEPGTVMAIDAANAGKLCIAQGAYNRRVAGVVSGAGDIPMGAILGNLPGHEDAPPIALTGRVWVRCDAASGTIEPGDLLTTSETPGHAMKVADHGRAQGAILGKAMTALKQGETGLVLVLVSLQ